MNIPNTSGAFSVLDVAVFFGLLIVGGAIILGCIEAYGRLKK